MKKKIYNKALELIKENAYSEAYIRQENGEETTENNVIASDAMVDIFYDLYEDEEDENGELELDERYDELCQLAHDHYHLMIYSGEMIISGTPL